MSAELSKGKAGRRTDGWRSRNASYWPTQGFAGQARCRRWIGMPGGGG